MPCKEKWYLEARRPFTHGRVSYAAFLLLFFSPPVPGPPPLICVKKSGRKRSRLCVLLFWHFCSIFVTFCDKKWRRYTFSRKFFSSTPYSLIAAQLMTRSNIYRLVISYFAVFVLYTTINGPTLRIAVMRRDVETGSSVSEFETILGRSLTVPRLVIFSHNFVREPGHDEPNKVGQVDFFSTSVS